MTSRPREELIQLYLQFLRPPDFKISLKGSKLICLFVNTNLFAAKLVWDFFRKLGLSCDLLFPIIFVKRAMTVLLVHLCTVLVTLFYRLFQFKTIVLSKCVHIHKTENRDVYMLTCTQHVLVAVHNGSSGLPAASCPCPPSHKATITISSYQFLILIQSSQYS